MGTTNHDVSDDARTTAQRLKQGLGTSAALGATVTVVAGTVLVNGQPVGAGTVGSNETPSTNVTILDDFVDQFDDETSLREAVNHANNTPGADTITFDPALFAGGDATLVLRNGALPIRDNTTLTGPGRDLLTISTSDPIDEQIVESGFGDGRGSSALYLYGGASLEVQATTITADGSVVANNSYYGYYGYYDIASAAEPDAVRSLDGATEVVFSDTNLSGYYNVIDLANGNLNLTVTNSVLSGTGDYSTGISARYIGDVTLTGVEFADSLYAGIYARYVDDVAITDASFDSHEHTAARMLSASSVTVTDTTVTNSEIDVSGVRGAYDPRFPQTASIVEGDDSAVTVAGSTFVGSRLSVRYSAGLLVDGTSITSGTFDDVPAFIYDEGIPGQLYGSRIEGGTTVIDSTFDGASISMYESNGLVVENTTITNSSRGAISTRRMNGDTVIAGSTIANNSTNPFFLDRQTLIGDSSSGCGFCGELDEAEIGYPGAPTDLRVVNSTITGNEIAPNHTLIANGGTAYSPRFVALYGYGGSVVVESSTITDNSVADYAPILTSGFVGAEGTVIAASTVEIDHSIVTANGDMRLYEISSGPPRYAADADQIDGPTGPVSIEYSLLPTAAAPDEPQPLDGPVSPTNIFTDDPSLGDLADNGGDTDTMMPYVDSPALDAGNGLALLPPVDQRGATRPAGDAPDIGAVERQIDTVSIAAASNSVAEGSDVTLTVSRTGSGDGAITVDLVSSGTADVDDDYTLAPTSVTFDAGETGTKDIVLAAKDDTVADEGDETVTIAIDGAAGATVDVESVDVTITDTTTTPTTTPPPPSSTTTTTTTTATVPDETTTTTTTVPEETTTTTTTVPGVKVTGDAPPAVISGGESTIKVTVEHGDGKDVKVSATSSNPALLEVLSVTPSGNSGNAFTRGSATITEVDYDVRVRAAAGGSGNATITVTADDGTVTGSQSFTVEVSAQTLPATGSDTTKRTGLIGALLIGFGAITSMFSRRRRA